ncbi:type II toxin-antitoxin system RelE/ParE family toxin [Desulfitobacterium hafniense]|uniref:type II toxin-antitoxin system RelE/ParE family toxin n=1 Tax=Desulfitobacterium hafniense TaxID=49338 RepID=UPI000375A3F7|nr:cytotoxin [Desulfitobacterium hafniense]
MKIKFTSRFKRSYSKLPKDIQLLFEDKIHQFKENWRHPSFRTHMLKGTNGIWSASLNMEYRFTFRFTIEVDAEGNTVYLLRDIGDHDHIYREPY